MGEKILYDTILARSFSKYDQKRFGYGAFVSCLLIAFSFYTFLKPSLGPIPILNKRVSIGAGLRMLRIMDLGSIQEHMANDTDVLVMSSNNSANIVNETNSLEIEMVVDSDTSRSSSTISYNSPSPDADNGRMMNNSNTPLIISTTTTSMSARAVPDKNNGSSEIPEINPTTSNSTNIHDLSVPVVVNDKSSSRNSYQTSDLKPIMCETEGRTETCEMKGDIRVDGKSSTVFMSAAASTQTMENSSMITIKPYARKGDEEAMNHVRKWSVKSGYELPQCTQNHKVPGIVFSMGGYAGNNFHDFTDIVIPLFLTSREFDGEVKFLVTDMNPWWANKFRKVLKKLSKFELIDIDKDQNIHCFQTLILGLKRNPKELNIDPSKPPHFSMKDFKQFLRNAYSLPKQTAIKMKKPRSSPPRLLIVSRRKTRAFTNINDIAKLARRLGYKVTVAEADSNVAKFAETVNSCDVMVGVHGAGLTNMVFLPENAVLIQILPIGGFEWLARTDFEEPSKSMNLRYLEYKIKTEESTLIQQFPADDDVFRNPSAIAKKGWNAFKNVYLSKQNVKLDVRRFRPILLKALQLLH